MVHHPKIHPVHSVLLRSVAVQLFLDQMVLQRQAQGQFSMGVVVKAMPLREVRSEVVQVVLLVVVVVAAVVVVPAVRQLDDP